MTDREQFEAMKRAAVAKYGLRFDEIDPEIRKDFDAGFNAGIKWQAARAALAQPDRCEHGIRFPHECKDCLYGAPAQPTKKPWWFAIDRETLRLVEVPEGTPGAYAFDLRDANASILRQPDAAPAQPAGGRIKLQRVSHDGGANFGEWTECGAEPFESPSLDYEYAWATIERIAP
jgi:hypothetical protein